MVTGGKQVKTVQPERLSGLTHMGCESLLFIRKMKRALRRVSSAERCGQKSNRMIDAQIDFYGQYIQLNEQVTLQNQDPKPICA